MFVALVAATLIQAGETARTKRGVVVCDEAPAAEVGAQILREGGNAIDAAVAIGFALAVVEPAAGNIGGGGFMLVRRANGDATFIDYREEASRHATRDMYLGPDGNVRPEASTVGPLAAGVPGTVAGFGEAQRRYGRLSWKQLVEPAYRLASEGFAVSSWTAGGLRSDARRLRQFAETASQYYHDGQPYASGEILRLPDLANTLKRIRDGGPQEFYRGETARLIADHMRRHGGLVDRQDLARYRVHLRKPIVGTYRGYTLLTAPPPSSGGIALVEMLNMLENSRSTAEVDRLHELTEAMKFAFADRSEFLGDPEFVSVPGARLTAKAYAGKLWARLRDTDIPSAEIRPGEFMAKESLETTHFSVVDADGNAVANTYTLNGGFGCGDSVDGAGFLLNNEMDDFAAKPGTPNMFGLIQGEKNAIGPGKRPLSSMTPTIVTRDGRLSMVLGSPGGPTIINTVLDVFLDRARDGLEPQECIRAPRFHHQWLPDVLKAEALAPEVAADLRRRGHKVTVGGRQGIANCIFVDPVTGERIGVADRRNPVATAAAE